MDQTDDNENEADLNVKEDEFIENTTLNHVESIKEDVNTVVEDEDIKVTNFDGEQT